MSPKEVTLIPHLTPDTAPTPQIFAVLVLTQKPILLELLAPREPRTLPSVILTSAIAGWGLTRIFHDENVFPNFENVRETATSELKRSPLGWP